MPKLPLVSILTPTYNRRPFIAHYLRFIRGQDYRGPIEILIADDGESIADLLKGDSRIRYFHLPEKTPLGRKRNLLADEARGDILVHMDDDDFYPPDRVSHVVSRLESGDGLIAGASEHFFYFPLEDRISVSGPFGPNHSVASAMAYRREYLDSHRFEDLAEAQEEPAFTDGFTAPMVQLDPRSTILGIVHRANTWDKRNTSLQPTALKLKDFVRNMDDRRFYRNRLPKMIAAAAHSQGTAAAAEPTEPERVFQSSDHLSAGQAAFQAGLYGIAENHCQAALAEQPHDAEAHILLGEIRSAQNLPAEAEKAYEQAARLFPGLGLPFSRLATLRMRRRHPATAPRPADPERPRLQMSTLGSRGRFGNQLLQYGYARTYADRHGLELEVPDWLGRDLYGHDDPLPARALPVLDESQADFGALLRGEAGHGLEGRDISGYFCWSTGLWGAAADEFRGLFRLVPSLERPLAEAFDRLTASSGTTVAVHLRRGDFGQGRFWVAPVEWYLDWLEALWPQLDRPCLYLATDAPELAERFADYRPILADNLGVDLPGAEFLADHYWLCRADHLAISNSTFSFTAALLNGRMRSAVRPDPVARCLTPFTPWNAPVLLDPPRAPEALGAVELELLGQINTASALVLHIGRPCSPWTNEVRAHFPRLPVHETDGEMPLDQLRGGLPLPHLAYVRVESASRLPRVLQDARQTLGCARIDCIEFTLRGESVGREVARVLEMGYRLLSVEAEGMRWLPEGRMRQSGKYLLMHERLLHAPPEDGQPLIDLRAEAGRHGVVLAGRGVLHVGAHEGRETPHYQALGMEPIVLVEANPAVYQRLVQGVGGQPGVMTVQRAISDHAGQVELHLASFDQSSSLLPMDKHAEVYPDIRPAGTISVEASRLDDLVTELGLHPRQFALLHIDVQGAERLVLSGAEAVLGAVEAVSIEVNFAELYRSCAQIEVIEDLLGSHGFRRVALTSPYHPSWGDALYLRRV